MKSFIPAALVAILAVSTAGCGGGPCTGSCECSGDVCSCGTDEDCAVQCGDGCDLTCSGGGECQFFCGDACNVTCSGPGPCLMDVGTGGNVTCSGAGACQVNCDGDCNVSCPGSGGCTVYCELGFACDVDSCSGPVQSCPAGVMVCGTECP